MPPVSQKLPVISLLTLLACGGGHAYIPDDRLQSDYERASILEVQLWCGGQYMSRGTGFAINDYHMLTAKHVVSCSEGQDSLVMAQDSEGRLLAMKVVALDHDSDVALLTIAGTDDAFAAYLPLAYEDMSVDETACILTAVPIRVRKCGITQPTWKGYLMLYLHVVPGNSGSPVLNEHGEVAGLVIARMNMLELVGVAEHVSSFDVL